jgi:class 3 adenylate cyclase
MDRPETRFAWNGDDALAYQVLGGGPTDLIYRQGWASNLELNWEHPTMARFLTRLARSRRLIVTDPRGVGLSERASPHDVWSLETSVDDTSAVLDAVGSDRAAILANNEQAFVACMFAATYPERTAALVLYQASANFTWSSETPWEWTEERWEEQDEFLRSRAYTRDGTREELRDDAPSKVDDPTYVEWRFRYGLFSEAPGHVIASARKYRDTDIRPILTSIQAPTLVLVRPEAGRDDWHDSGRHLASRIPGARLLEIPGRDQHLWLGGQDALHDAIDGFLADVGRERQELDRVLATVLFIDIVGSTALAVELGDRRWRELLERHRGATRALLARFRGVEVDTAGDGFFATFDGPARAVRCATAIVAESRALELPVRAGVHTGEIETVDGKAGGIAVHIGARIGAMAGASEVIASQTVRDLVAGSGLVFEDAGEHELKGVPDRWRLYRVTG